MNYLDKHEFVRTLAEAATWPNMAIETAALQRAIDELEAYTVPGAIGAFYELYARRVGKGRWGDKTPPYRSCILEIQRLLPEAHFIHIICDGRDTALSYQGLWFEPGDDMETQAKFWVGQISAARQQATRLHHYIEVKFERLVSEPESTLGKICEYLRLGFNPMMLQYHRRAGARLAEHKQSFGPANGSPPDLRRFLSRYTTGSRAASSRADWPVAQGNDGGRSASIRSYSRSPPAGLGY